MTFRTRILLACLVAAAAPLMILAIGARREVAERLGAQFEARVRASSGVIRDDLARQAAAVDARLAALAVGLADEAELRAALLQRTADASVRDYAPAIMPVTGLDYLLLVDSANDVLSSGHFRNDYGRPTPVTATGDGEGPLLVAARRPERTFLALVRSHSFTIAGRRFALAGGVEVDSAFLRRLAREADSTIVLSLEYPGGELRSATGSGIVDGYSEQVGVRFVDDGAGGRASGEAVWSIHHSLAPLRAVQRGMDRWLITAIAAAVALALLLAHLLASRVNRPLEELAARARRIDLERLDTSFATRRQDEVGSLSRVLDAMMQRLRASIGQLRAAERRATIGDVARQVNHDIRNGLLPIRNVIRHLGEVAEEAPAQLAVVFAERAPTLHGGIGYLEKLATSYARLSPGGERQVCDVNAAIRSALDDASIRLDLADAPLTVAADPVALRRVIENLVVNAVDSLENGDGTVTVGTRADDRDGQRHVIITVADTGAGIDPAALDRVFDDFYTTKEHGTGLGLSIVRRLVTDMGGRIRVDSERGRGTTFRIELPEAG